MCVCACGWTQYNVPMLITIRGNVKAQFRDFCSFWTVHFTTPPAGLLYQINDGKPDWENTMLAVVLFIVDLKYCVSTAEPLTEFRQPAPPPVVVAGAGSGELLQTLDGAKKRRGSLFHTQALVLLDTYFLK